MGVSTAGRWASIANSPFRRAKMNEGSGNAARLAIKYPFCGGTILA
jgi:hypothetical protein